MKTLKIVLLLFVLLFISFSCGNKKEETIKIGVLSVFTGDGANYGEAARTGVDLAIEEINNSGGINGRKIEIIYVDSKGTTKDSKLGLQQLINYHKVPAVIGPFYSDQVSECAPEANRNKVVLISGSATADDITNAGDYIFRVCPVNRIQGKVIAEFCINDLKSKTAFVLYRNADYGVTLRNGFKEVFENLGGKILGEESVERDSKDLRTQLYIAKQKNPDVVFAPVHYPEGGVMLKQAKEINMKQIFIGGDGAFDPKLIEIAGSAADNSYWSMVGWGGNDTKEFTNKFIVKYKEKYKKEPGAYSGLYFDATWVLALALKKVTSFNGEEVKNALYNIEPFKGATGITKFDSNGDVDKPFSIFKVEKGNFILIK